MSVRYTATWYDVTQARQQETHTIHTDTYRPGRQVFSVLAGRGGGHKPVSEGHRGDTHTPDRQITEKSITV